MHTCSYVTSLLGQSHLLKIEHSSGPDASAIAPNSPRPRRPAKTSCLLPLLHTVMLAKESSYTLTWLQDNVVLMLLSVYCTPRLSRLNPKPLCEWCRSFPMDATALEGTKCQKLFLQHKALPKHSISTRLFCFFTRLWK